MITVTLSYGTLYCIHTRTLIIIIINRDYTLYTYFITYYMRNQSLSSLHTSSYHHITIFSTVKVNYECDNTQQIYQQIIFSHYTKKDDQWIAYTLPD